MARDTLVAPRCTCPRPMTQLLASYCGRCGRTLAGIVCSSTAVGVVELSAGRSPMSSRMVTQITAIGGRVARPLAVVELAPIDAIDVQVALQRLLLLTRAREASCDARN